MAETFQFNYTGNMQEFIVPAGVKRIQVEAWGGSGGGSWDQSTGAEGSGKGGYTKAILNVESIPKLYVYVGQKGGARTTSASWNGGGAGGTDIHSLERKYRGGSGGGASDIRLIPSSLADLKSWNNPDSLQSRLVVAGGAGGGSSTSKPGNGGGLTGADGDAKGGTQQSGGASTHGGSPGSFGVGGKGKNTSSSDEYGGHGGGGGWYGGGGTGVYPYLTAGGGSGYVASDAVSQEMKSGVNTGHGKVIITLLNSNPTVTLTTADNRTLYENDTYNISGSATDTDSGNVVMVKYQINGGTIRTIATQVSTGAAVPFNRVLTFKAGVLYDGATAVTGNLAEGTQHVLTVWAEDDRGGKSAEQTRTFYVVPFPNLTVKVNGEIKTIQQGFVKINGETKVIQRIWTKVNGVLREG